MPADLHHRHAEALRAAATGASGQTDKSVRADGGDGGPLELVHLLYRRPPRDSRAASNPQSSTPASPTTARAISPSLRATLDFLETMTLRPDGLQASDAQQAMDTGVSRAQLEDAAAVAALFNIITRYSDALDFAIPTDAEFDKAAGMLLKRGYR